MNSYEKDYEVTMASLDTLYRQIESLEERKRALETLIRGAYPHKGKLVLDQNTTPVQGLVNVFQPRVTERVKGLLMASAGPLTCGEIYEQLKQLGITIGAKSNPWALIHGICRRLVEQKFAREVDKDGRKAWVLAK
jgi:hypothetical protein